MPTHEEVEIASAAWHREQQLPAGMRRSMPAVIRGVFPGISREKMREICRILGARGGRAHRNCLPPRVRAPQYGRGKRKHFEWLEVNDPWRLEEIMRDPHDD